MAKVEGYTCTFMTSESGYHCPACGAEVIPFVTHHCGLEKSSQQTDRRPKSAKKETDGNQERQS